MTIYVDSVKNYVKVARASSRRYSTNRCHLMADTREELDAMALAVGVATRYRQHSGKSSEHYDLTSGQRAEAIRRGAVPVRSVELITRVVRPKREQGFR